MTHQTIEETQPSVAVRLRAGTARLRPLRYGEVHPLEAVFDAMSPESRRSRYLRPVPALTRAMRRALTEVDGHRHVAWVAGIDGRPAGVGRYVKVGPDVAEIAFEVADDLQGLGLGAVLLDTITTVAAVAGIRRLQALVLGSNRPSQHLLSRVGLVLRPEDGVLEADGRFHLIEPARVDRSAVVGLAFAPGASAA